MALLLGHLPGVKRVELDPAGDAGHAGLAGLAGREVAGLLGLPGAGPVRAVADEEAGHEDLPPRPALPRRTRPGSHHRLSPRTRDGERQLPASGRLVNGIIPAAGITPPSGPGMVPGHADDPGTVPSVLAPHDDLHIGDDRL
jgi:hypothetical protein